ncbi:MAG: glycosyltransferase family 39 protein [Paracoccus sp. (in: a-proteobacteria)]|nr:glycosyltransferase family 39 protein [Paracoccus sp. (in: a-proteobacteria)]
MVAAAVRGRIFQAASDRLGDRGQHRPAGRQRGRRPPARTADPRRGGAWRGGGAVLSDHACGDGGIGADDHRHAAAVVSGAGTVLAQHRLAQGWSAPWAVLLGLSVGAGMLAKHAMLYGVADMALAAVLSPGQRIGRRDLALAAAVALIAVSLHLWWLAESRFVTVQHMAESGASRGVGVNVASALRFLAEQFAVMGLQWSR